MPGMNGKILYERLLQTHADLHVLYISGYAQNVLTHKGALEEGTQLLAKPFTVEALLQAVQDRLHPRTIDAI
jgi:FixJ family two-component response regulator